MKTFTHIAFVVVAAILVSGCAQMIHLNEPSRSKEDLDLANLLSPRNIPYETQELDGVSVSYNLFTDGREYVRLTLVVKNTTASEISFSPEVTLVDSGGVVINPYTYEQIRMQAVGLLGTQVPMLPPPQPSAYTMTGSIQSLNTGNTYTYSGSARARNSFAQEYATGYNVGSAIAARQAQDSGYLMLRWIDAYWLRKQYSVQPGSAAVGALLFPANQVNRLPLKLSVKVGSRQFVFVSKSSL